MSKPDKRSDLAIAAHDAIRDGRLDDANRAIDELWRAARGDAEPLTRATTTGADALRKRGLPDVLAKIEPLYRALTAIDLEAISRDFSEIDRRLRKLEQEAEPGRIPARWFPLITHQPSAAFQ